MLVILLDDVGFGASSAFGGPINMAGGGTARGERPEVQPVPHDGVVLPDAAGAVCTGRNHHSVGMGGITEIATCGAGIQLVASRTPRRRWPRS